jgi:hypothetical protein
MIVDTSGNEARFLAAHTPNLALVASSTGAVRHVEFER